MDEVFIDASFWIARMFRADQHHEQARSLWSHLRNWPMVTTNWTLYEALTFLNGRTNRHDLALDTLELASITSEIINVSEFEIEALNVFTSYSDKQWSVVDCANFVCIKQRESSFALSFDGDFAQAQAEFGFTLLGA